MSVNSCQICARIISQITEKFLIYAKDEGLKSGEKPHEYYGFDGIPTNFEWALKNRY